ncbi:hypothetical protein WHR41_05598 [Cladosporium halotolerans]|uniref:Kinetochore protein Spc24 n=1 Tax=Cladosporium halotolerans TaxID=1052096 RepID=A0AB34KN51_9PEZI
MVLFDEDPVTLISETTNQFHIAPDKDSLTRISSSLNALGSNRASRLAAQQNALKSLSRRLNNLHSQHEYEENRHDAGKHASEILALDAEKFRIAKSAYDVEVEGERLEGELAGLKAQLDTLEREGVEGSRRGNGDEGDEVLLKLQVYRSLGVDVSQDANTGTFNRAVIRNPAKGDVNVVNVDGKLDKSFYANMFWDSL